jgi:hypothetical protein
MSLSTFNQINRRFPALKMPAHRGRLLKRTKVRVGVYEMASFQISDLKFDNE